LWTKSRVAPRVAELLAERSSPGSPWLTTTEAIEYTRLPEGTFRKLAASGKIPSHGGRAKLFYRSELDATLLSFDGIANESRRLRTVR
jgi:excisionase family DNA binding protein